MQKVLDKGKGYIQSETERVKKIMAGKVTPEKKDELQVTSKQRPRESKRSWLARSRRKRR